ncbi:ABC transporter permease [Ferruginibacter sp. SUN106]|uniref:ABC transporter permease n=1 Tax=Ferruginibacter sp. SUN106 TaxID=2978348 RepID=UPI003D37007E
MFKFNLKIAWRNIRKNKVFSAINIIGLAVSLACCFVIGIYVWTETHYDSFHTNLNSIYRITNKQNQAGKLYDVAVTPGPLAPAVKKDFPEVEQTVRFGNWSGLLKNGNKIYEEKKIQLTEHAFFSMFSFPLLKGNPAKALLSPDEIVITENTAEKYFGKNWSTDTSLLGQVFTLNGQNSFKLSGVVANPPQNSSIQFDVLLPVEFLFKTDEWANNWGGNNYHTYLQLKPGTNIAAFEKKIAKELKVYKPDTDDQLQLQPLTKQYLYSKFAFFTDWGKRSDIRYVKIFSGVGLLLLLIACVNFVNLSTARSLKRAMEVGVRKVNGASRKQLVVQFLSESVLIALLSGFAAVVILKLTQPLLQQITGTGIAFDFNNGLFLSFLLLFVISIGLIAGLYPAFILSAFNPVKILKGKTNSQSGSGFRKALVITQFAICVTLMICTFFMYRQLQFIQQKDLGFNTTQIIRLRLGNQLKQKVALLKHDLDNETAIAGTAPATMSLVNVDNSTNLEWEGMHKNEEFLITQANVDPDFIPTLGMQLIKGENFKWQNEKDTINNFIVNETAVKLMGTGIDKIIGKKVKFYGATGTIVGVVKDFNFKPLSSNVEPFIFRYQPWSPYFNLFIKTVPGKTTAAIDQLTKLYKKYEPETPLEFTFLNESINQIYQDDKRTAAVIFLFACLTVFVGCLGLFGLTVFATEQRIKEIGIRKVLGAGILSVTQLLSKDFLKLVLAAVVIALPVAWYIITQWLQNYAYRIHLDWWVFATVGIAVLGIAFITISFQTIRAALSNPVKSLRTE